MSYDTIERSVEAGQPIYFYRFKLGTTGWFFTAADHDVPVAGSDPPNVWKSVAIRDDGVKQTGEAVADALSITAPVNIGPVQVHLTAPPPSAIQVAIYHGHLGNSEIRRVYSGEVSSVKPGVVEATIICETTAATMQREGLRLGWQRTCPYALYDSLTCKVSKSSYGVAMTITSVQGFYAFVDHGEDHADNYFGGGFVEWDHPIRGREFRGIELHNGNQFLIFGTVDDMYPGLRITAYPGCSRTSSTCLNKFNNLGNYGGVPGMPGKSPFSGDPVF